MSNPLSKILAILLLLLFSSASCALAAKKQSPHPRNDIYSATFNQSYPGTIIASSETQLAFRVAGPLINVAIKPGDRVKKGQLLMQIDPRDFKDNIRVLEAQLAGAESLRNKAKRDFDRAQTLFEQQVNATADFDHAKSTLDSAFAGEESLKAQLQIARHKLKDTSLRAPYTGVITTQSVENFEMVSVGKVVLGIQDISTLEAEIKIPENEIARRPLQLGREVAIELPAIPDRTFTASLVEWSTAADPVTRTYALRFSFAAPTDVQVLPGMTAEVSILNTDTRSSVYVPEQKSSVSSSTP